MSNVKNQELVCNPAVKFKFVKKFNMWCRTWFEIEKDDKDQLAFVQKNAWHKDRNADWKSWGRR